MIYSTLVTIIYSTLVTIINMINLLNENRQSTFGVHIEILDTRHHM